MIKEYMPSEKCMNGEALVPDSMAHLMMIMYLENQDDVSEWGYKAVSAKGYRPHFIVTRYSKKTADVFDILPMKQIKLDDDLSKEEKMIVMQNFTRFADLASVFPVYKVFPEEDLSKAK